MSSSFSWFCWQMRRDRSLLILDAGRADLSVPAAFTGAAGPWKYAVHVHRTGVRADGLHVHPELLSACSSVFSSVEQKGAGYVQQHPAQAQHDVLHPLCRGAVLAACSDHGDHRAGMPRTVPEWHMPPYDMLHMLQSTAELMVLSVLVYSLNVWIAIHCPKPQRCPRDEHRLPARSSYRRAGAVYDHL